MRFLVVYYSLYGYVKTLAEAVAEGARSLDNVDVMIRRVPETLSDQVLDRMGALEAKRGQEDVPTCTLEELAQADAIVFGTPARFGNMAGQMRQFLDSTGQLWLNRALVGKVGSVITSSSAQHGGQESTILSFHITLLHHGMIVAGLPYTFEGQTRLDEITGCSPYGASTVVGTEGKTAPSENELAGARFQGQYVAEIAKKLVTSDE